MYGLGDLQYSPLPLMALAPDNMVQISTLFVLIVFFSRQGDPGTPGEVGPMVSTHTF